jgi:hypothetical protein
MPVPNRTRTRTALLVAAAALVSSACGEEAARDDEGNIEEAGSVSAFSIREGDCFSDIADLGSEVTELPAVPCEEPHGAEVIHVFDMPDGDFPGDPAVQTAVQEGCGPAFEEQPYAADLAYDMNVFYPTQQSWEELDDREIVCVATGDFPFEGSTEDTATEDTATEDTATDETVAE